MPLFDLQVRDRFLAENTSAVCVPKIKIQQSKTG